MGKSLKIKSIFSDLLFMAPLKVTVWPFIRINIVPLPRDKQVIIESFLAMFCSATSPQIVSSSKSTSKSTFKFCYCFWKQVSVFRAFFENR